jgi:hypothetical protein
MEFAAVAARERRIRSGLAALGLVLLPPASADLGVFCRIAAGDGSGPQLKFATADELEQFITEETAARLAAGKAAPLQEGTAMDFGSALEALKDGTKMTRLGWNASGQFIVYQPGYPGGIGINSNTAKATGIPEGTVKRFRPYLMLHTAQGDFVPWAPSVSDVLAEDWSRVSAE